MNTDDDPAPGLPSQMIGRKRQRAAQLRDAYIRQAVDNDVSEELIKELASVCLEYRSCLREFRDDHAGDDLPDLEPIRSRLGETTTVKRESRGRGVGLETEEVPAVQELDAEYLIQVTHALDDYAADLSTEQVEA